MTRMDTFEAIRVLTDILQTTKKEAVRGFLLDAISYLRETR
jgi:hypothetical protein